VEDINGMSENEKWARLEMLAALPDFKDWAETAALVVENALSPALEGRQCSLACTRWMSPPGS
jgi:hypothetical protein